MKNLILFCCAISLLFSCKDKEQEAIPDPESKIIAPKADFNYTLGEHGELNLNFVSSYKDHFMIDSGNGNIIREITYGDPNATNIPVSKSIRFAKNGNYKITLTVANIKGVASSSQTINIDNIPPPPMAGFTYQVLPGGKVRLINQGKNAQHVQWYHFKNGWLHGALSSTEENPVFTFENNGMHHIQQTVSNKYVSHTLTDSVYVSNAPNTGNPVFEGVFFDQSGKLTGSNVNTVREHWGPHGPASFTSLTVNNILLKGKGNIMITMGLPDDMSLQGKYKFYKEKFAAGLFGRVIVTKDKPLWTNGEEMILLRDLPNASMEIIKVEEVDQPELFPGLYHRSFWVTFNISADLGYRGKIDGKLKVRYLVY